MSLCFGIAYAKQPFCRKVNFTYLFLVLFYFLMVKSATQIMHLIQTLISEFKMYRRLFEF